MDVKSALKGQYRAGLRMLRQAVTSCPTDLWASGTHPRTFWRIAYHTVFYTHLYLMRTEADFVPWPKGQWHGSILWLDEHSGDPPDETTYTPAEVAEYIDHVLSNLDEWVDLIDPASRDSGFPWYSIPKLDHQILNIRHLGTHVGQLQELLYARGIDNDWQTQKRRRPRRCNPTRTQNPKPEPPVSIGARALSPHQVRAHLARKTHVGPQLEFAANSTAARIRLHRA